MAGIITAPFTFGASLGLTIAGLATTLTSGVAGATHGVVKSAIVQTQINNATESLEKHKKSCEEMQELIGALQMDKDDIRRLIKNGKTLFKIASIASKNAEDGVRMLSSIHVGLSVTTAVGIVKDMGSLIENSVNL